MTPEAIIILAAEIQPGLMFSNSGDAWRRCIKTRQVEGGTEVLHCASDDSDQQYTYYPRDHEVFTQVTSGLT